MFKGAVSACIVYYRYFTPVSDVNRESGAPEGRRLDRCILVERLTASAAVLASTPRPIVSIAFLSARLYSHLSPSQCVLMVGVWQNSIGK